MSIDNTQDIIDSRDIIERIEELEGLGPWADENPEEAEELDQLQNVAAQASGYAPDWEHGEALIRESYFQAYAQQLAEDCGMVNPDAEWPNNHIDWEAAAEQLKVDYAAVDFDGITYYIR